MSIEDVERVDGHCEDGDLVYYQRMVGGSF
jgi:hypothetical protein